MGYMYDTAVQSVQPSCPHDLAQIDCIDVECKTGKLLKRQGEVGQQVVPVQPTRLHATAGLLYTPAKYSKSNSERRRRLWGRAYQTWVWICSKQCVSRVCVSG